MLGSMVVKGKEATRARRAGSEGFVVALKKVDFPAEGFPTRLLEIK